MAIIPKQHDSYTADLKQASMFSLLQQWPHQAVAIRNSNVSSLVLIYTDAASVIRRSHMHKVHILLGLVVTWANVL